MNDMEIAIDTLREHANAQGALGYHLSLMNSPLLSNDVKIQLIETWEEYSNVNTHRLTRRDFPANPATCIQKGGEL